MGSDELRRAIKAIAQNIEHAVQFSRTIPNGLILAGQWSPASEAFQFMGDAEAHHAGWSEAKAASLDRLDQDGFPVPTDWREELTPQAALVGGFRPKSATGSCGGYWIVGTGVKMLRLPGPFAGRLRGGEIIDESDVSPCVSSDLDHILQDQTVARWERAAAFARNTAYGLEVETAISVRSARRKGGRPPSREVADRREKVRRLLGDGLRRCEICERLSLMPTTYDEDRKALKQAGKLG